MPRFAVPALAALLALVAGACAFNRATGRPQLVLTSQAEEERIGEQAAAEVERSVGIVAAPELGAYVRAIGRRLAAHVPEGAPRAREFRVVDLAEPNAFALPGGHVFVSRGLLELANSEDELAGVLAHEIAHVAARHSANQAAVAAPLRVVAGIGALAAGIVSPALGAVVGSVGEVTGDLVLAPHSRSQEREADELGQRLVAAAGWDPAGLARLLATLGREERLAGGSGGGFLSTHPATEERVAAARSRARELRAAPARRIAPDRAAFLRRIEGLVVGDDPRRGVLDGDRLLHPGLDFSIRLPPGWEVARGAGAVASRAPDGSALLAVGVIGEGRDPLAAGRAFEREHRVSVRLEPARIGGLPAARGEAAMDTRGGVARLSLTWVAHAGRIYGMIGLSPLEAPDALRQVLGRAVESFRPLRSDERRRIQVVRLRLVPARSGERVAEVARRAGSVWSPAAAAIANAVEEGDRLEAGWPVKLAFRESLFASGRAGG